MKYLNENLRNWLLGQSEIDQTHPLILPPDDSPEQLLEKFKSTQDKNEILKINKKLSKMGYEVKTFHVLSKK